MHTPEIPEILIKSKDKAEQLIGPQVSQVVFHPLDFAWQTIKAFRANQGLLLAGALGNFHGKSVMWLLSVVFAGMALLLTVLERYVE